MGLEWYRRWRKARLVHHTCKSIHLGNLVQSKPDVRFVAIWALHLTSSIFGFQACRATGASNYERHLHGELQYGMLRSGPLILNFSLWYCFLTSQLRPLESIFTIMTLFDSAFIRPKMAKTLTAKAFLAIQPSDRSIPYCSSPWR